MMGSSQPSERVGNAIPVRGLAVLALAVSLVGSAWTRPSEPRFSGEYGLVVHYDSAEVRVRWLTETVSEGKLIAVSARGDTLGAFDTPEDRSHTTAFPRPDSGSFWLEYGAQPGSDDWHRTAIDLNRARKPASHAVDGADSIFVLGDTHGEFDVVRQLLRNAGLIDATDSWSGGSSHLVFLGDIFDRGSDVTALLWFIYRLEREAQAGGGRVHVVLGNHEIMVMSGDLRYVAPKEEMVAFLHRTDYAELFDPRSSVLGAWLATKPALLKVDEVLLAHGGVSSAYLPYSLQDFRDTLSAYVARDYFGKWGDSIFWANYPRESWPDTATLGRHWDFFWDSSSVFWYRGYVTPRVAAMSARQGSQADTMGALGEAASPTDSVGPDRTAADSLGAARLAEVLKKHDAEVHVIGHTTVGTIEERFGGALIAVDMEKAGTEMLLLARSAEGRPRHRLRYSLDGPPVPISSDGAPSSDP